MNKKVLIITYYWPPSGGSGVQRWLKFVKYLPGCGWEPHVFTPENPAFSIHDPSLAGDVPEEAEIIRFPIWEPYDIFFRISGWFGGARKNNPGAVSGRRSVFGNMSTWIRGNLIVPDPRVFWVRSSVKFLKDYVADNRIPVVVTTGPPHSLHLIGLNLKKNNPSLQWLADFRDPWSEWGLLDSLRVGRFARARHRRLERRVLAHADKIVTITPFYVKRFQQLSGRPVTLLTNGFDEQDFTSMAFEKTEQFTIRHVGIVNEKCDPRPFMLALKDELAAHAAFATVCRVEFVGEVHPLFRTYVEADAVLSSVTIFRGNVPHDELMKIYGSSGLLLLILTGYKDAEGFLPGKLFEYMATGLPVLGVGPVQGDAAALLTNTGAGLMVGGGDRDGIRNAVRAAYQRWRGGQDSAPGTARPVAEFSRRHLTRQLADLMTRMLENRSEQF